MSGAQMYIRNKLCFLENSGWNVLVLFYTDGPVLIDELVKFIPNRMPVLEKPVQTVSGKEISDFVTKVRQMIPEGSDVVIESLDFNLAFWGEILAQSFSGKHLFYPLTEKIPVARGREGDFLSTKYRRGEFVAPNSRVKLALPDIELDEAHPYFELPSYSNVVSTEEVDLSYNEEWPVVLSLGRLEKTYIKSMLAEIIKFCETNDVTINLFVVGSAPDQRTVDKVRRIIDSCKKIKPTYFGYMYPIPLDLIRAADVAIASSGSVFIPYKQGIPTIAIDINTHEAIGVYGHTTFAKIRTTEPIVCTSGLLEDILLRKKYPKSSQEDIDGPEDSDDIFRQHLEVMSKSSQGKQYYDVQLIYSTGQRAIAKAKFAILQILHKLNLYCPDMSFRN